jgi:hyperosmotically inducible protein
MRNGVINKLCAVFFTFLLVAWGVGTGPAAALELNPFSAIKSAVEAAVEDRSSEDIAEDLRIKAAITADVIGEMGTDVISISSDVYEQDVMLTGSVEKEEQKKQAEKLNKAIEGVKKIYNEILVKKPLDKEKGAVENFVDDSVIEGKINALLLDASGVNVTNFRWRSVGGTVFLFGRALSKEELKKAIAVVKDIDNVVAVTSRVKVRPKSD